MEETVDPIEQKMRASFLIQRLDKPPRRTGSPLDKVHRVFGGGMLGLSNQQWDVLDEVFEIHYMGAAEYEFGTIPQVLTEMVQAKLTYFEFVVPRKDILANEARKYVKAAPKAPPPNLAVTVYVICKEEQAHVVEKRIRALLKGELRIRDSIGIQAALDPIREHDTDMRGGLELSNGFFFFIDKTMAEAARKLFLKEEGS